MASISRMHGLGKNTVYRIFADNISVPHRFYHLSSVISIDEFKATSDKGTYAFNIVNPLTGKTIDIIEDRKAANLRSYFLRFPFKQRKNVKIIVMDLSGAFRSIMHAFFLMLKLSLINFIMSDLFAPIWFNLDLMPVIK